MYLSQDSREPTVDVGLLADVASVDTVSVDQVRTGNEIRPEDKLLALATDADGIPNYFLEIRGDGSIVVWPKRFPKEAEMAEFMKGAGIPTCVALEAKP